MKRPKIAILWCGVGGGEVVLANVLYDSTFYTYYIYLVKIVTVIENSFTQVVQVNIPHSKANEVLQALTPPGNLYI